MKYIIEIKPEYEANGIMILGARDSHLYVTTLEVKDLEELNSDYINEHYGQLQDDAYQRGLEDGKAVSDKGCVGCKWEGNGKDHSPCDYCCNCYSSQWTAKQTDDEIKVGDEVETKDGKRFIVTTFGSGFDGDIAVGVCADGLGLGVDLKELCKTGRHFDIASILKEMQS